MREALLDGYPVAPRCGVATLAIATAAISSGLFGYQTVVLNPCAGVIAVTFQWCGNDWQSDCPRSNFLIGLLNSSAYVGAALGAYLYCKPRVTALGARRQVMVSDVLFVVGGLSSALARHDVTLVVGRFLSGVGFGLCIIAGPQYIAEIYPTYSRGTTFELTEVGIAVGILLTLCLGLFQGSPPSSPAEAVTGLDLWYWRFLLGFQILPAILQLFLFLFVAPLDTATCLVRQGLIEKARTVLYETYGMEVPEDPLNLSSPQDAKLELEINERFEILSIASRFFLVWPCQRFSSCVELTR